MSYIDMDISICMWSFWEHSRHSPDTILRKMLICISNYKLSFRFIQFYSGKKEYIIRALVIVITIGPMWGDVNLGMIYRALSFSSLGNCSFDYKIVLKYMAYGPNKHVYIRNVCASRSTHLGNIAIKAWDTSAVCIHMLVWDLFSSGSCLNKNL